jgi:tRNA A37 methylthiotransferase MiaB
VFPYSDRPGTMASALDGRVDGPTIRARGARVREIGHELTQRFRASQVGLVRRALTLEDGQLAVTDNYLKIRLPPGRRRNEWVNVRITGAGDPMTADVIGTL